MADINLPSITPQYPGQTSLVDVMRGYTDAARSNLDLQTARATQQATIEHAKATADTAQIGAKKARYAFDQSQQQQAAQFASTLAQDPELIQATADLNAAKRASAATNGPPDPANDPYERAVANFGQLYAQKIGKVRADMLAAGLPADKVEGNAAHLSVLAMQHPEMVLPTVNAAIRSYMSPEAQNATQTPAPQMLNTGSAVMPVTAGNPANTGMQPGAQAGPATALTVSPSERETMAIDPATGKPYVQQKTPAGQIQTAPIQGSFTPGGKVAGMQIEMNAKHRDEAQKLAEGSAQTITNLDEMAQEVKKNPSIVGTSDFFRRATKALSAWGIGSEDATQADIMNKLAARMAQGGNTDYAGQIKEMANPNIKMTPDALVRVTNMLKSVEQKNLTGAQFFGGLSPDSAEYQQKRNVWQQNADPRLWELKNSTDAERAKMLGALPPETKKALGEKLQTLRAAGLGL